MENYSYYVSIAYGKSKWGKIQYEATLNKGGEKPIKELGLFDSEESAKAACLAHYNKASKFMKNMGMRVPNAFF